MIRCLYCRSSLIFCLTTQLIPAHTILLRNVSLDMVKPSILISISSPSVHTFENNFYGFRYSAITASFFTFKCVEANQSRTTAVILSKAFQSKNPDNANTAPACRG